MLQNSCMVFTILRHWIAFFISAFYRRFQTRNIHHALAEGPVIIAMNHPNAFTDPVLFQLQALPHRLNFLARGDAFKPGFVTWFLQSIGIVPIFRIQDGGKEGLKKNEDAYRRVNYLLSKGQKVIVFAEGLCIQERRLRPLKKGVARMVFGAYEHLGNDQLKVVPVCVNYNKAHKFRSNAFHNVGEPIAVKDFYESYLKHPARAQNAFLQALEPRMRELLTHIEDPANDELVEQLEIILKPSLLRKKGMNPKDLYHDFLVVNELTELVNKTGREQPELIEKTREKCSAYFNQLHRYNFRDWLFDPQNKNKINYPGALLRLLLLLAGLPVFIAGLIGNYLPFKLSDIITNKIVKVKEFYSSIAIGISMVMFLIYYTALYSISAAIMPQRVWPALVLLGFGLCACFSIYYHPFARKTFGIWRVLLNQARAAELREKRGEIEGLINKFYGVKTHTPAH